ncbi:uncharacterized protein LOC110983887 [Acanthaster planci]|uniref:Uncharacterized protein LOC110983887 n=1 Tax=Acanthaster planci TaxID=133434 RepID=A0A8B7Z0T7_ACAPL|nr:uncharacterized protein LOC110983887 [Acanthaster planci]
MVIFNNQGCTKYIIQVKTTDVVATSKSWVCANPEKVFVYRQDATLAYEFPTVPMWDFGEVGVMLVSVAVMKNGNILVGDMHRMVLTEHKPDDGKLIHTIPVEIAPNWLAVMSNGWIVISDEKKGQVAIVDVSDGNATQVTTIKPIIDGQPVKYCRGVSSNGEDIFVAAVKSYPGTGHIHNYHYTGRFVSCVARDLHWPMGITLTADRQRLVAADWYSVKIYHQLYRNTTS